MNSMHCWIAHKTPALTAKIIWMIDMSKFNVCGHEIIARNQGEAISIYLDNFATSPFIRIVVKPWK